MFERYGNRFLPFWFDVVIPIIKSGQKVLIVAHGNSLRALAKHLDNISDVEIPDLNIPTGIPLVYHLDNEFKPIQHFYLGDQDTGPKGYPSGRKSGKSQNLMK